MKEGTEDLHDSLAYGSIEPWKNLRGRMGQGQCLKIIMVKFFPELMKHTNSQIQEI